MPTHKFVVKIIGGTWNGYESTFFTESHKNLFVHWVKEMYGIDCQVEKIWIV